MEPLPITALPTKARGQKSFLHNHDRPMEIRVKSTADHYDRTTGEDVYSSREAALQAYQTLGVALGIESDKTAEMKRTKSYGHISDAMYGEIAVLWGQNPRLKYKHISKFFDISVSALRHDKRIVRLYQASKEIYREDARGRYREEWYDEEE